MCRIRRIAIAASPARPHAARALRLPPPATAGGGHAQGGPRVRHCAPHPAGRDRSEPSTSPCRSCDGDADGNPWPAAVAAGRRPTQARHSRFLVRVAVAARRDRAPPPRVVNRRHRPPSPPLSSVVPSGRPGRWVGLPVFSRSREPVCATGGLGPRPSGSPWRPTSGYTRWGAAWTSLKPARFPLCPQGNCHSRCPFGPALERTLRVAACQID